MYIICIDIYIYKHISYLVKIAASTFPYLIFIHALNSFNFYLAPMLQLEIKQGGTITDS